uniref:Uncharacterized protein n=1 Tax=Oryza barthii TaxID=65489 RepID=A0A0D3G6N4_9ORYZ
MALQVRRTGGDGGKKAVLRRGGGMAVAERKRRYGQGPQGGGMAAQRGGDKVGSKREDKTGPVFVINQYQRVIIDADF